jgi:hypothetical protein
MGEETKILDSQFRVLRYNFKSKERERAKEAIYSPQHNTGVEWGSKVMGGGIFLGIKPVIARRQKSRNGSRNDRSRDRASGLGAGLDRSWDRVARCGNRSGPEVFRDPSGTISGIKSGSDRRWDRPSGLGTGPDRRWHRVIRCGGRFDRS